MLYYCRGCSTPLVTGWESCKNCGYPFEKSVPEYVNRDAYNAHKITYWPPRKPTALELFMADIWNWIVRAPIAIKLIATVLIVGGMVYKGVTDAQQAGIPTNSPTITVSTDGDSTYAAQTTKMASGLGADDSSGPGASDATGGQGTDDEDPSAPLSETEGDFVRSQIRGMASEIGDPGTSAAKIVPDDPPATKAVEDLSTSEKAELQQQLNDVADSAAAEATPAPKPKATPKVASMTSSAANATAASAKSSSPSVSPRPSGSGSVPQSASANTPSHEASASNSPSQNTSNSDKPQLSQASVAPNQSESSPNNAAANNKGADIVLHMKTIPVSQAEKMVRRPIRIRFVRRGPTKAMIRMKSLYYGARSHYVAFAAQQNDPQYVLTHAGESSAIQSLVHQAVLVYPRLSRSERTEWKQEVIAMLVWKIEMVDVVKAVQALNAPSSA